LKPLVSVIIPCYNQGQFLEEALASVANQTFSNWECIIVDDGSTIDFEDIVKKLMLNDTRISFYKKENGGLSSARNFGIEKAKGAYILPLDADDKIASTYLENAVKVFEDDASVKVVYGNANYFGNKTGNWELPDYSLAQLAKKNCIYCSALFLRKDWEVGGGYDEKMIYGLEDWDFWISLLKDGGKVIKLKEVCFYYRIRDNSMVRSITKEQKEELWSYLSQKHTAFFIKHLGSFIALQKELDGIKSTIDKQSKSKRFALNMLFKNFLGFYLFKNPRA
jgi:glycosyltransferase involved in cell wall biosynthesis